jgi:hypothetical protein
MKRIVSSFVAGGPSALFTGRRTSGGEIDIGSRRRWIGFPDW